MAAMPAPPWALQIAAESCSMSHVFSTKKSLAVVVSTPLTEQCTRQRIEIGVRENLGSLGAGNRAANDEFAQTHAAARRSTHWISSDYV